jgi:succinyl-diaminopimelate desuccinylase
VKSITLPKEAQTIDSPQRPNKVDFTEAFEEVEKQRHQIITLLQNLIQIPTIVPPGNNYEDMVDFLEPHFQKLGFETERVIIPEKHTQTIPHPIEGPRVNLVARRNFDRKETVTLYAHMDVVPVEGKWTKDPFAGTVENDKLYGRGALDMKSGIAALLTAFEVMEALNLKPQFNIVCTLCTDEELGVYPGSYHLAKEGYMEGHIVNLELGSQMPLVVTGMAGTVDIRIRTKGRGCHSGMSFLGVNAVEAMIPILTELLTLKTEVEKRESTVSLVPFLKILGAPSKMMTPMLNIDVIRGGTKSNIIPSSCEIIVNRRYIPEESYKQIVKEFEKAIKRGKKKGKPLEVEVEFSHIYPPFKADPTSPYALKMRSALAAVHSYDDQDFTFGGAAASTDMGFVSQALNTNNIIGLGAASFGNLSAHKPDEWVGIPDLLNMTKQLIHYLVY